MCKIGSPLLSFLLCSLCTPLQVSVHDEIDTCFERIKFEIEVFRNKQSVKGDILLRKLRKEKDDLISYVNFLEIEKEEKQKYIDEIEKHFFILTKLY